LIWKQNNLSALLALPDHAGMLLQTAKNLPPTTIDPLGPPRPGARLRRGNQTSRKTFFHTARKLFSPTFTIFISRSAFSTESLACAALTMIVEPNSRRIDPGGALEGSVGPAHRESCRWPPRLRKSTQCTSPFRLARRCGIDLARRPARHELDDVIELNCRQTPVPGYRRPASPPPVEF